MHSVPRGYSNTKNVQPTQYIFSTNKKLTEKATIFFLRKIDIQLILVESMKHLLVLPCITIFIVYLTVTNLFRTFLNDFYVKDN